MKVFSIITKIVVALAAVAGAVYLAATYGERVVAWAKKTLSGCSCCDCDCDCDCDCCECDCDECDCECDCDECDCECDCCDETAEEVVEEEVATAEEVDFEA